MPKTVVPEANRRRRRPTKQGVVLSEALIVETALRMVRDMARMARERATKSKPRALGADASTVYTAAARHGAGSPSRSATS